MSFFMTGQPRVTHVVVKVSAVGRGAWCNIVSPSAHFWILQMKIEKDFAGTGCVGSWQSSSIKKRRSPWAFCRPKLRAALMLSFGVERNFMGSFGAIFKQ